MAESCVVVHHHTVPNKEMAAYNKGGATTGEEGLKRLGREQLLPKLRGKVKGAAPKGQTAVVATSAGVELASVVAVAPGANANYIVARYCMPSLPNLHLITFVCREADFETQREIFQKVVKSLRH